MSHVSSSATAAGDVEIRRPFASLAAQHQLRPSWWRSLWFRHDSKVAGIRGLMLTQLMAGKDDGAHSALAARIVAAEQAEALWSLRQEWMQALVEIHGEMLARRRLTDISFMFAGLLNRQSHADTSAASPDLEDGWQATPVPRDQLRTEH